MLMAQYKTGPVQSVSCFHNRTEFDEWHAKHGDRVTELRLFAGKTEIYNVNPITSQGNDDD